VKEAVRRARMCRHVSRIVRIKRPDRLHRRRATPVGPDSVKPSAAESVAEGATRRRRLPTITNEGRSESTHCYSGLKSSLTSKIS